MYSKPRPQKDSRRAESAGCFGPPPPPPPPPSAQDVSEPRSREGWVSPARSNAAQPSQHARRPPSPAPPRAPDPILDFSTPSAIPQLSPHILQRGVWRARRGVRKGPGIPPPSLHPSSVASASRASSPICPISPRSPIRAPPAPAARSWISEQVQFGFLLKPLLFLLLPQPRFQP